jgi:hypothetical protein
MSSTYPEHVELVLKAIAEFRKVFDEIDAKKKPPLAWQAGRDFALCYIERVFKDSIKLADGPTNQGAK